MANTFRNSVILSSNVFLIWSLSSLAPISPNSPSRWRSSMSEISLLRSCSSFVSSSLRRALRRRRRSRSRRSHFAFLHFSTYVAIEKAFEVAVCELAQRL